MKNYLKTLVICQLILLFISSITIEPVQAQQTAIGEWNFHLSYQRGRAVEKVKDRIYCGTKNGLYYVKASNNEIERLSPLDGFSGTTVTAINYDEESNNLFIAYKNGMLDVVKDNEIQSFTAIASTQIIGDKTINAIDFHNNTAYLCTTFGVVEFDIREKDFASTYFGPQDPGLNTFGVAFTSDSIFLSSENGLLRAPNNKGYNLKDPNTWQIVSEETDGPLGIQNNCLYTKRDSAIVKYDLVNSKWKVLNDSFGSGIQKIDKTKDTLFIASIANTYLVSPEGKESLMDQAEVNDLVIGDKGRIWYTHQRFSLIKKTEKEGLQYFFPNGPYSKDAWSGHYSKGEIYIAGGGLANNFASTSNKSGYYKFNNGKWENYNNSTSEDFKAIGLRDVLNIAVSPLNGNVFLASYLNGLVETDGEGNVVKNYNESNSKLQTVTFSDQIIRVTDARFDNQNNLWINNNLSDQPLVVKTAEDKWYSYSLGTSDEVLDLEIDDAGQKWIQLFKDGVIVFNDNGTLEEPRDDRFIQLNNQGDQGNFPTAQVNEITKDKEGNIWLGTNDGIAVFFDPESIFERNNVNAQQIFIEDSEDGGYLLSGESVNAIAIDGANNKWMGTDNGVWKVTGDGSKILKRFNEENSPLTSNQINDIVVQQNTGEIFFATDEGIISYRAEATEGSNQHNDVYAFPNPVTPDYSGPITIKGLVRNANVKITDVNDHLVTEMEAQGGQAVWDGTNLNGSKVSNGVYFVYSSSEFGEESFVTKILIIGE